MEARASWRLHSTMQRDGHPDGRDGGTMTASGRNGLRLQAMAIRHRNPARDAADDAHEALIGSADEKILEVRDAVELLVGRAVDGPIVVT